MTSGPEIARLVNEFELNQPEDMSTHHEVQKSFQTSFGNDVKSLVATYEEFGNPFLDQGKSQCDEIVLERLEERKSSIFDPIKRNKLSFFTSALPKKTAKLQQQLSSVKSDCALFSRLYISCQTRDGDLDDFFMHENQGCRPSLSNQGKLRLPKKKSELVDCLLGDGTAAQSTRETVNVTIIDGTVAVNMIRPSKETTFEDYALKSFLPYIETQSRIVDRIDVVWDVYVKNSLKHTTRCNRGAGVRRRISASSPIPRNWGEFLCVDENKTQLFKFLAEYLSNLNTEKQVITTVGNQVLCTEVSESCMISIERYTVLLYDRTSNKSTVNEARKQLFAQKGRSLDAIPPSRAALVEHTRRAAYQAGHCWGQALKPRPVLSSPESWGWTLCEGKWEPYWTTLPGVTQ
ncbi:Hypothetical predicted protein, partial [Paramuricea clavata]